MNPAEIPSTEEARRSFYPTPPALAEKMLAGIDLRYVSTILEPSAGTGNLIRAVAEKALAQYGRYESYNVTIDAVELDPHLRSILKYEWCGEKREELVEKGRPYTNRSYNDEKLTESEKAYLKQIDSEIAVLKAVRVNVVHDDFFTFRTWKAYNLILMNPPFESGALHLSRAIKIAERNGGKIVCLLNAETIRNPYSLSRKLLAKRLEELDAEIEYVNDAFLDAERQTDVEVAIVRVEVPVPQYESEFYSRMRKREEQRVEADPELRELVSRDYLQAAVQSYNVAVDAVVALYHEWQGQIPRIRRDLDSGDPIVALAIYNGYQYEDFTMNGFLRSICMSYWKKLLSNEKFTGRLTSDLRQRYQKEVDRMADFEFSMFNIQQIYLDMSAAMCSGIEKAVLDLFDEMTVKYAHWSDCKTTVHYYSGWRTNQAHKIGKKVILPTYCFDSWDVKWGHFGFDAYKAENAISDIEKALDYIAAKPYESYDISAVIQQAKETQNVRNVQFKYFRVDFFKKGTIHIKFNEDAMPIVERLNIFGSQKHGWLPPNYGKSGYSDMDAEERAVVDSFHGNGSEGSGAVAYAEVLSKSGFYLASPTQSLPALNAPQG